MVPLHRMKWYVFLGSHRLFAGGVGPRLGVGPVQFAFERTSRTFWVKEQRAQNTMKITTSARLRADKR